ncbi:MAG: SDR family NAD(P)-dependent oxidoreductase [Actinomycetaceae bacterium]|nr:SDR family NAD(P)-dependent oxidoreductase [Actinomycetaceae bacterium]
MSWAVITGASSGLGEEFAWQFAAEKVGLVLVARRKDRLVSLAHKISQVAGIPVEVLVADLEKREDLDRVCRRVSDPDKPVDVLVNNAGFGLGQSFLGGDRHKEEAALDVMVRAVLVLSHAAAHAMSLRGRGAIINVASATAGTAMGTYASHKTWVVNFTEGLSTELQDTGVHVTAVLPGLVHTDFHETASMDWRAWPTFGFISRALVVREAIEAARRGRVLVTPSVMYQALGCIIRHAPRPMVRALAGAGLFARALDR